MILWIAAYLMLGAFLVGMGKRACQNDAAISNMDLVAAATWPMLLFIMLGYKFCDWLNNKKSPGQGLPAEDRCGCGCEGHA